MSDLDKKIKNKLEGYRSEVNPNMWAKIESSLPHVEQATSRNLLWTVFGLVFIVSLIVGYYLLTSNAPNTSNESLISSINNEINFNDQSLNETKINRENHIVGNLNSKEILTGSSNDSEEILKPKEIIESANGNSPNQKLNRNTEKINSSPNQINNAAIISGQDLEKNMLSNTTTNEDVRNSTKVLGTGTLYQQYNSILKATKSNQDGKIKIIEREMEDISRLIYTTKILENETSDLNSILDGMANKRTICPTFSNVRFGIFAEAFYSNDFGLRDLSYNYLAEGNYLEARNNTESANYSFSAGARVSFIMPSGFGAKTGFTYSQINESFKYFDESHKKTKTIIIKEYIWENNIIVDSIENTEIIEVEGALNVVSQNKYKVIDLPLLLTYEWGYKNRLYYSITGGPLFNIRFSQRGKFLNPETLTPVDFTTGDGNYQAFNTNIGTSIYLAFALNYQLGNGADIFVEPNMRHNLKNTTLNSYELNQKYTVFGLGFGIKYKL